MNKYIPETLCNRINFHCAELSYQYAEHWRNQILSIADKDTVKFSKSAGGGVAGGSANWIRQKHQDGGIHEPGLIAALLAIEELNPNIQTIFDIGALYGYFTLLFGSIFRHA